MGPHDQEEAPPTLAVDLTELGAQAAAAAEKHDDAMEKEVTFSSHQMRDDLTLARKLVLALKGRPEQLTAMEAHYQTPITGWLLDLPIDLGVVGLVDDALELATMLGEGKLEPAAAMAQKALVYARADRHTEARTQVEQNLAQWPKDMDVLHRAAETLTMCGDEVLAEKYLRQLVVVADEEDPFFSIQARDDLADLLRRHNQTAEADKLEAEARERMEELGGMEGDDEED